MVNPIGRVIKKNNNGRQLVIPDIHGCTKTFEALFSKINPTKQDQIFLLGDYVTKGPDSKGLLEVLISLRSQFDVHFLLGNHDLELLDYFKTGDGHMKALLHSLNCDDFFEISDQEKEKYLNFLESLYYYFILDDFILVHAGLNFSLQNPFLGLEDILNIRDYYYDGKKAQNKTIVHGHVASPFSKINEAISGYKKIIPLDNGAVNKGHKEEQGYLLCLNLETYELVKQENVDF